MVDFPGIAPVSDGRETGPRPPAWAGAPWESAIGAPSAEVSLVGLRPRRARLRFPRRPECSPAGRKEQEQGAGSGAQKPLPIGVPLNPGGSVLRAGVGPFCAPITSRDRHHFSFVK